MVLTIRPTPPSIPQIRAHTLGHRNVPATAREQDFRENIKEHNGINAQQPAAAWQSRDFLHYATPGKIDPVQVATFAQDEIEDQQWIRASQNPSNIPYTLEQRLNLILNSAQTKPNAPKAQPLAPSQAITPQIDLWLQALAGQPAPTPSVAPVPGAPSSTTPPSTPPPATALAERANTLTPKTTNPEPSFPKQVLPRYFPRGQHPPQSIETRLFPDQYKSRNPVSTPKQAPLADMMEQALRFYEGKMNT